MGIPSPRPPLPKTASKEEMIAELEAIKRQADRYAMMNIVVIVCGFLCAIAFFALFTAN